MADQKTVASMWEGILNPDVLRPNLISASIYIAGFEILKDAIIDRIKEVYTLGGLPEDDEKYRSEVLSSNPSRVYSSLHWLKENRVIDDNDAEIFEKVKQCRNDLSHRLAKMLTGGLPDDLPTRFAEMVALLDKIERWWIVNVEIATDPQFDDKEVDESGILPGRVIAMQVMTDVALGSDEDAKTLLEQFREYLNLVPKTRKQPA